MMEERGGHRTRSGLEQGDIKEGIMFSNKITTAGNQNLSMLEILIGQKMQWAQVIQSVRNDKLRDCNRICIS